MIQRELNPNVQESFFLFGARGTGKSTWLESHFKKDKCFWLDLLDTEIEDRYLRNPKTLEAEIELLIEQGKRPQWVVIDEVQKIPRLLDIVHRLIEHKKINFALTGSSARKLKRGHANLLGGRAALFTIHPFTYKELGKTFNLQDAMNWGTLPKIHFASDSKAKARNLRSYCNVYIKEEVLVEQLVRNLSPFKGFLEISAQMNGKKINYESIAREVRADNKTVQSYYDILEETHLGHRLLPFGKSIRKSQKQAPKFYWFDLGVSRFFSGVLHSPLSQSTGAYGDAFEAFLINELIRHNAYHELDYRFSYLETHHEAEIDLILTRGRENIAIEIKSASQIDPIKVRRLEELATDLPGKTRIYYLSQDPIRQKLGSVTCLPWKDIFKLLGSN